MISDLRRALLNDDDPAIGAVKEEDHSSDTIVISPKELNLIKTRSGERIRESKPVKEIRERRERRDLEKRYDQTDNAKKEPKKNKVDDEATGLEKILTGLGVAAAIVIVAVVIVFVLKLGGLFRSSTPEDPTKTVSEESMTEEAKTTCGIGDCYQPEGSLYAEACGPLRGGSREDLTGTRSHHAGRAEKLG